MEAVFISAEVILLLPIVFFALYLALLTLMAMVRRPRFRTGTPGTLRRFAILVPAHNEEALIERTLQSLKSIEYPRGLYDITVISDNSNDRTAHLSRASGVFVLERRDPDHPGKGQALRWGLERLRDGSAVHDAYVVIDADTVVSPNMLTVMNQYLESGAECIQCADLVQPQPGSWSPELTRVAFLLHNWVRPLGRKALDLSTGLNGNGMCFSADLVRRFPWRSYSRVEDLEYAVQLMLSGVKVEFAPETAVLAAMPAVPRGAESQRRRWEIARYALMREYGPRLIFEAFRNRSAALLEMLVELVIPPFVTLVFCTAVLILLHALAGILGAGWVVGIGLALGGALLLELFHVLGGLWVARARPGDYAILVNSPRFFAWKLGVYMRALLHGDDTSWVRTGREHGGEH